MLEELVATAQSFALGDLFLGSLVGDFTEADWQVRDPAGHGPRWIVGHLAATRLRAMVLAGLPEQAPEWAPWFKMGTSPAEVPADLDPRLLVASFHASQEALAAHWDAVGATDLARPLGRTLPGGADTVGGALRFLAWHEAYHLGQLGLLRRLAGKPGRA
jgi:hypothetical protein